jgi:GNAT superfamily N-acetyltransferase
MMNVVDLDEQHVPLYLACLEDWSDELKEAGNHKAVWYQHMKDKGLRVKLSLDDQGTVGGMIQYGPIEHSFVEGADLDFIYCIWVHGHTQGRGNFQGRGMGSALLEAAENDTRSRGKKGIVAWGLLIPVFMRASWFRRHGYRKVDRTGMQVLLWKPFASDAVPPRWILPKAEPSLEPNKVTVTALCSGWCPSQSIVVERARRAAADPQFAGKVAFREVSTLDRAEFLRWGYSGALFIDRKQVRTGPPLSHERIHKLIEKRAKKIRSATDQHPLHP